MTDIIEISALSFSDAGEAAYQQHVEGLETGDESKRAQGQLLRLRFEAHDSFESRLSGACELWEVLDRLPEATERLAEFARFLLLVCAETHQHRALEGWRGAALCHGPATDAMGEYDVAGRKASDRCVRAYNPAWKGSSI